MYPILFEIGHFTLRTYGVVVAIAFFVAFFLLYKEAKRKNFYPDKILDIELLMLISGIIGARALHVLVNLNYYGENLGTILLVWKGGLAFHGGMILAFAVCWVFIVRNRMPLWKTADFIVPYVALGHSIGRIGCFLNGCCFGKPATAGFLGVIFPGETICRYPTQLYASLALLGIFVILKFASERAPFSGFVLIVYFWLFGLQRFVIGFLRGDNPTYIFGLTIPQLISVFIIALGIFLFFLLRNKKAWKN